MSTVHLRPVERLVFFTDAVVAIAMTLLILPLLESVTDAAKEGLDTGGYLRAHDGQLVAFALSFVIIAAFWRGHDRLFEHVEKQDGVLLRPNVAWMFTIVWLPVATALIGALETDRLQLAVYIGTMLATSLIPLSMRWWLGRRPALVGPGFAATASALTAPGVSTGLFALALVLAVTVPGLQFWSLLVLLLEPLVAAVLRRVRHP
ncbi:hypothetical protein PROP_00906 [Propionicimonas sp. T2.31MG-18]|uniref:TMEM175 family protein n=1 Tax=Propionicimonas sp. T2.31MG-18 TaxID=3157620 RepID=UPI0035EF4E6C